MDSKDTRPAVLSIGGTDPSSGAGVYLDNRVLHALGVHCCPIASVVTAQNSDGVTRFTPVCDTVFGAQLDSVFTEFSPGVIKAGLLGYLAQFVLLQQRLDRGQILIWDPVLSSSSGTSFLRVEDIRHGMRILKGKITLFTPNIPEASLITGISITDHRSMIQAADCLVEMGIENVVIKGGHEGASPTECRDLFYTHTEHFWVITDRIGNGHRVRGTGCTFASAVAAAMARGDGVRDAVVLGRAVVSRNIENSYGLGGMRFQGVSAWPTSYRSFPVVRYGSQPTPMENAVLRCDCHRLGVYPVVDSADWVRRLLETGIRTIQLRMKTGDPGGWEKEITTAVELANQFGARLFINDHWQLAIRHHAYGVHLGQEDLRSADIESIARAGVRLGVSVHGFCELAAAINIDPSYIAVGPVFESTSKRMEFAPQGVDKVRFWVDFLEQRWPLVAVGGIDMERSRMLMDTGVGSIAMISAITRSRDYVSASREFIELWEKRPV